MNGEDNVEDLLKKFQKITVRGWIKSINNDNNGVGLTLENLLGKKVDSEMFPDYRNIEIKCSQRYSNFPINLFNKTLDGPRVFELDYLLKTYGLPYYEGSDKYYLFVNLIYNQIVLVNNKYYFKLCLSMDDNRLYIYIYNLQKDLIDSAYIDLISIKEHLQLKLSNMAVIYASKMEVNKQKYFRYYLMQYYKLKSVNLFYDLIKNNTIKVSIVCRAAYANERFKQKNKGIIFRISKQDIEKLFEKIFEYNSDEKILSINSNFLFK